MCLLACGLNLFCSFLLLLLLLSFFLSLSIFFFFSRSHTASFLKRTPKQDVFRDFAKKKCTFDPQNRKASQTDSYLYIQSFYHVDILFPQFLAFEPCAQIMYT
jgi:hypothetical protein